MRTAIDKARVAIEAKQRAEDDIRKDLEIAKLEAENAAAERVRQGRCCRSKLL